MNSLSTALKIATGSLGATQVKLSVSAHNIANADTKGFTTKHTSQSSVASAGNGGGVEVSRVESNVSKFLLADLFSATTATSEAGTRTDILDSLQKSLGAIKGKAQSTSIASLLAKFEDTLTKLSGTPESVSLADAAVRALQDVTQRFNKTAATIAEKVEQVDDQIGQSVDSANQAIREVHSLNQQLREAAASGQTHPDLNDKLHLALESLASTVGIQTFHMEDGSVKVYASSGQILVGNTAHPLSTDGNGGKTRVLLDGSDVTDTLSGGRISALVDLRDSTLPKFQVAFDALARNLKKRLNVARPDLLVGDAAQDLQVNAAILKKPTTLLGTSSPAKKANALLDAMQSPGDFASAGGFPAGKRTFTAYANEILASAVNETAFEKRKLNASKSELETVINTIASTHGVNVNEETARLAELKQLYSVSSTVLKTIQDMFEDLKAAVN